MARTKPAARGTTNAATAGQEARQGTKAPPVRAAQAEAPPDLDDLLWYAKFPDVRPPKGWKGDLHSFRRDSTCEQYNSWSKEVKASRPVGASLPLPELFQPNPDAARLAFIKNHPIGKSAERKTGHTVEELLSSYCLRIGNVHVLDNWVVVPASPKGKVKADHADALDLLLLAWWLSTPPNPDVNTNLALNTVGAAIEAFHASYELKLKGVGKVNEAKKKQAQDTSDEIKRHWTESKRPEHERAHFIARDMTNSGHKISKTRVRQVISKLGLRKAKTP